MSLGTEVILMLLCLLGTALYAGLETGVISIHRLRLRHLVRLGNPRAKVLQWFLERPDDLLGTTLVGTNLCMVTASVLGAVVARRLLGSMGSWVSGLVMTIAILLFCEYIPKAWFQARPAVRSMVFAGFLRVSWSCSSRQAASSCSARACCFPPRPGNRRQQRLSPAMSCSTWPGKRRKPANYRWANEK